ncbi:MAG: cytochrome c [Silicimonas sp.]|nr:cytochrome c [Silicimonas sp.]
MRLKTHFCTTALIALSASLLACQEPAEPEAPVPGRWYTATQASSGEGLFQAHCASCHGDRAQGLAEDWRKTDADGNYPPPPLNGSAHAWHHPMAVLQRTIVNGGAPVSGVMPGFGETLSEAEVRAVIAYFQSLWADETYARWQEINAR